MLLNVNLATWEIFFSIFFLTFTVLWINTFYERHMSVIVSKIHRWFPAQRVSNSESVSIYDFIMHQYFQPYYVAIVHLFHRSSALLIWGNSQLTWYISFVAPKVLTYIQMKNTCILRQFSQFDIALPRRTNGHLITTKCLHTKKQKWFSTIVWIVMFQFANFMGLGESHEISTDSDANTGHPEL